MGIQTPMRLRNRSDVRRDGHSVEDEWSQAHFPAPQYSCLVGLSPHDAPRHQSLGPAHWLSSPQTRQAFRKIIAPNVRHTMNAGDYRRRPPEMNAGMREYRQRKAPQGNLQSRAAGTDNARCRQPLNGDSAAPTSAAFFPVTVLKRLESAWPGGKIILRAGGSCC